MLLFSLSWRNSVYPGSFMLLTFTTKVCFCMHTCICLSSQSLESYFSKFWSENCKKGRQHLPFFFTGKKKKMEDKTVILCFLSFSINNHLFSYFSSEVSAGMVLLLAPHLHQHHLLLLTSSLSLATPLLCHPPLPLHLWLLLLINKEGGLLQEPW